MSPMPSKENMNILHLLSWFPTPEDPTLGNFCLRMIGALPETCHSAVLAVGEREGIARPYTLQETHEHGYTLVRVESRPAPFPLLRRFRKWRMYQKGLAYLKESNFQPDLLHLHVAWPLGRIALAWHRRYGYPYLLTEHWSIYLPQNQKFLKGRLKRRIVRIAQNAALILPVSRNLQQQMERIGIRRPYRVIRNVVDTSLFQPNKTAERPAKKQLLHVSTLQDEVKNFSGILRVVERLRQQRDDFELHVIHDYDASRFQAFVREHGLEGNVFFHGKKSPEEVAGAYAAADCFVLFSHFETLSCVLLEAFAAGIPVLATAVGGIPEIVSPERGLLVPDGDEEALLQALIQMLDTCRDYDREAIRRYAVENFSENIIGQQLSEAYRSVLKEKQRC